jgi:hypothetical protein
VAAKGLACRDPLHRCVLRTNRHFAPSPARPIRSTENHRAHAPLVWIAATVIGLASLIAGGCGPLGAYSLAHSLLTGHHVFKPVLPDDAMDSREQRYEYDAGPTTSQNSEKNSSEFGNQSTESGLQNDE